jgi:hypothetical protein
MGIFVVGRTEGMVVWSVDASTLEIIIISVNSRRPNLTMGMHCSY